MDANETKIYTVLLIAAGVLAIILIYFIINIIRQQRRTLQLHSEKIHAEITAMENERSRIAADLHDDLGPLLSAVKLQINSVEVPDRQDRELIEKSGLYIDSILTRVREISNNLMPQVLVRKGLVMALQEFIDNLNTAQPFDIQFICPQPVNCGGEREIHIYRIVLEIVHNAIKHSRASELRIEIRKENNKLMLLAADNGIGFDYATLSKNSTGLGTKNIISRVEVLKGDLYIDSQPNQGTAYTVAIPL